WTTWSTEDTLHWSGSMAIDVEPLPRSTHRHVPLDTAELEDDDDRHDAVIAAMVAGPTGLDDTLDGFLVVLDDTVDQSVSTWQVFPTAARAAGWLRDYERNVDLPARCSGVKPVVELGFPAGDANRERRRSKEFGEALLRIAQRAVLEE